MRIAVLCLPGIGDSLMATPMIRLLRKKYPKARIDLVCMFAGVAYCFKNNKNIDNIYHLLLYKEPLLKGIWDIVQLRKNKYDISLLAFPAYRREYHIVQFLIGAKKRVSHIFTKGFWNEMNFLDTTQIEANEFVHNVQNNLHLLTGIGIKEKELQTKLSYDLFLDKKDVVFGEEYIKKLTWQKEKIIGIHPGSINSAAGLYKRWPVENFAELIQQLIKKRKKVLIFVGPFELDLGKKILDLIKYNKNCKLVAHVSFGQSLGILSQISTLVSNDNGFAHIANALRVRGIVLFGPTNPNWCSPINKKYAVSLRKTTYVPWFRNDMKVTHPPRGIHSGMSAISVKDVLTVLEKKR